MQADDQVRDELGPFTTGIGGALAVGGSILPWAVVTFRPNTPVSQRLAVRSACGKVPDVRAQPVPSNLNSPYALQRLTFRVDHATNADIAQLEKCLARFPSVAGITLQDSSDMG